MLKNVMISKQILEDAGFTQAKSDRYHTIMERGKNRAEVLPNGSVDLDGTVYDFKAVKRGKMKI